MLRFSDYRKEVIIQGEGSFFISESKEGKSLHLE